MPDKGLSTDMNGTGKALDTIKGDGGTGKTLTPVPGCTPTTGRVGGSTLVSPAASMVNDLKGS